MTVVISYYFSLIFHVAFVLFLDLDMNSLFFFSVFIASVNILQYLLYRSLRLISLLSLQLTYKILLLRYNTLIPPVIHRLYLSVELSLLLVKHA